MACISAIVWGGGHTVGAVCSQYRPRRRITRFPTAPANGSGVVGDRGGTGEPHHRDEATGTDERAHSFQGSLGVGVVEHGDRGDHVERARLERMGQDVADDETRPPARPAVAYSALDGCRVDIDAGHLEPAVGEIERQQPITRADVERGAGVRRESVEHDAVVVDVPVPRVGRAYR
jgi:hypothetical protein